MGSVTELALLLLPSPTSEPAYLCQIISFPQYFYCLGFASIFLPVPLLVLLPILPTSLTLLFLKVLSLSLTPYCVLSFLGNPLS